MILVKVKQEYTDYLRKFDKRVSYNIKKHYERPYVGVLFKIKKNLLYFAPLTTSGKGEKLKRIPKKESITFYPIKKCQLGGINFNNMIPLIKGVYAPISELNIKDIKLKNLYFKQIKELNRVEIHLKEKARKIYGLKINKKLYANYDKVTCDFKLLEMKALLFNCTNN